MQLAPCEIKPGPSKTHSITIYIEGASRSCCGGTSLRTAQDGFDAQPHFARTERLGHIIIRAQLQTDDAIHLVTFRGQHQNRHVAGSPDFATQIEPRAVGQSEI